MPLSKARMRERKRQDRLNVKPNLDTFVCPSVKPKHCFGCELAELYPDGRLRCSANVKEGMRLGVCVQPKLGDVLPNVKPKLPWYAGARDHFGEVKNKHYAQQFFSNLG